MSQIGLSAHSISIESQALTIELDRNSSVAPEEFAMLRVSGIAAAPGFDFNLDFSESLPQQITLSDFGPALGEWTAIAERRSKKDSACSEFLICNDEYGYSPLFFSLLPGNKLIVSDSFQGVIYELMRNGITPTLNLNSYITTVTTKDSRFANPLAWQTHATEVYLLPPHFAIHVTSESAKIIDRKFIPKSHHPSAEGLIKQGIDFVTGTLKRLSSNKNHSHSLLLSGGVDSRAVLALVLAAGAGDTFALRSNDPRNYKSSYSYRVFEDDFFISYALGNHYKMAWLPPRSTSNINTSLEEGLRISQPTSSNFSHAFPAAHHHPIYSIPEISLRGGGGEPIKGAGFLSLAKQVQEFSEKTGTAENAPFDQFKDWFVNNAIIDSRFKQEVQDSLDELQQWLQIDILEDLMPSYYQHSRNRTHFGHAKFSTSTNLFSFQPLSNSFFYAASELQAKAELLNYNIARYIFSSTEPALLEFPFEDPEATQKLTRGSGVVIQKNLETLDAHFRSIAKHRPKVEKITFRGTTKETIPSDKNAALISMCRIVANELEQYFPEYRSELKAVHKALFRALVKGTLSANLTVGRMMSARDIVAPTSPPGITFHYSCMKKTTLRLSIDGLSASDALPHLKRSSLTTKPPVVLNPKIQYYDGTITVEANPEISRPADVEFAFYLIHGGKAIQRTRYSTAASMCFVLSPEQNVSGFSVRSYARHQGTIAPCAIETTELSL